MLYLAPIVEGHGEVEAVPVLLNRIVNVVAPDRALRVNPPIRVKSGSFLNDADYFRRQVMLAMAKAAQANGSVLILLDCEDDCPAQLGPALLSKATAIRQDVTVLVVLAYREYESWFVQAARSLRGRRGLPDDLEAPAHVETIRNAKGWLSERMSTRYDPVMHQIEFTRAFDLTQARKSPSFDRLCRRIGGLLEVQRAD